MNQKEYDFLQKQFDLYYEDYKSLSKNIDLKYNHSYNVASYMEDLAKRLNLNEKDILLAKAIGLLHDIGRFEQLKKFDSFDDKQFDHADFAVVYLFEEGHIRNFIESRENDSLIKEAILNHNKFEIRKGLKKREIFFSQMIRDMDKVDIFYQIVDKFKAEFDEKPTKKVIEDFYQGKLVHKDTVKNKSDRVIQNFAFLNDYNFKESLDILKETNNFDAYVKSIKVKEEQKETFEKLVEFINKKLNN